MGFFLSGLLQSVALLGALHQDPGTPPSPTRFLEELSLEEVYHGTLDSSAAPVRSPVLDQGYSQLAVRGIGFLFTAEEGGALFVDLESYDFDAYLVLLNSDGEVLAEDDDGLLNTHARVEARLQAGQVVRILACALHGRVGDFQIAVKAGHPPTLTDADQIRAEQQDYRAHLQHLAEVHGGPHQQMVLLMEARGAALLNAGRPQEAIPVLEDMVALNRTLFGGSDMNTAISLHSLGDALLALGDTAAACAAMEECAGIALAELGEGHPDAATLLNNYAMAVADDGRTADSIALHRQALALREKLQPPEPADLAQSLSNLAGLLNQGGRRDEALQLFQRAEPLILEAFASPRYEAGIFWTNYAHLLEEMGEYQQAVTRVGRAAAIFRELFGEVDSDTIWASVSYGTWHTSLGQARRGAEILEEVLGWTAQCFGERSPEVATVLNNLGLALVEAGQLEAALEHQNRALEIRRAVLDRDHADIGQSLANLASLHYSLGEYPTSVRFGEEALELLRPALGEEDPDVASTWNNLGLALDAVGQEENAGACHRRALDIREKVLGPVHPETAQSLTNLGRNLHDQGRLLEARPLQLRAVEVVRSRLPRLHPDLARNLEGLAELLIDLGEFEKARELGLEAVAIHEEAQGPTSSQALNAREVLAVLSFFQGSFDEAIELESQVLEQREQLLGPDHPKIGQSLNNLALFLDGVGQTEAALEMGLRSLEIVNRTQGPDHRDALMALSNRASMLADAGQLDEAIRLNQELLHRRTEILGAGHPDTLMSLNNLGSALKDAGRLAEGRKALTQSLERIEEYFGPAHPSTLTSLLNLAGLEFTAGDFEAALELYDQQLRQAIQFLRSELPTMPEAQRFRQLAMAGGPGQMLASLVRSPQRAQSEYLQPYLSWKGILTRLQAASLRVTRSGAEREPHSTLLELRRVNRELSAALIQAATEDYDQEEKRIAQLREQRISLERSLNQELGIDQVLDLPSWRQVQGALPDGAIVLDFLIHQEVFVWTLRGGAEPTLHSLGSAARLDELLDAFLSQETLRGGRSLAAQGAMAKELEGVFLQPVRTLIAGHPLVLVSPDGFLCELPFGILPGAEGGYLLESHRFTYLSDTSQLLAGGPAAAEREGPVLAVGDINYFRRDQATGNQGEGLRSGSSFGGNWPRLEATREELQFIKDYHQDLLQWRAPMQRLDGSAATEEAVKASVAGQRYLHFATHGYFEPEHLPSLLARLDEAQPADAAAPARALQSGLQEKLRVAGMLPGLLSGLVLAGVNAEPDPAREDGYLSAEEVSYLDLSACDLAVLSACETALGSKRAGNGLMSLRRAFEVAGARTVVSSLWKVDDRAAATLMGDFYRNYWERGLDKGEALHQAKLKMLRQARAESGGHDARPETWGAFVLSGDWR